MEFSLKPLTVFCKKAPNPFDTQKPCKIAKIVVIRHGKSITMTMQKWTPMQTFDRLSHVEKS